MQIQLTVELVWMQISAQAISKIKTKIKSRESGNGFTFLEILVVLTLVLLILGTALPQFFAFFSKPIEKEFKHINSVLKTLRNDAVLKNTSYCLLFDLKLQQILSSEEFESGECSKDFIENPRFLSPHKFSEDLILREAKLAGSNNLFSGSINEFLEVHINSSGFVSPFMLYFFLPDGSSSWIIESKGIMGDLMIQEQ